MRRPSFLRLILVLLVATGLTIPLAGAIAADSVPLPGTFLDDDGNVHEGYIEAIADVGITRGCNPPANDAYCPRQPVTRGQAASFIVRTLQTLGAVPSDPPNAFIDDDASVHSHQIDIIAALGITRGCNPPANTMYCPDDPMTRAQMAAMLTRAFAYVDDDPSTNRFTDDDGSIFEQDIEAIAAAGVTKGCNPPANTMYCPNDPVYRDQLASFLGRVLGLTPLPPGSTSINDFATVFFTLDQPDGGPFLAPVARYVPPGTASPAGAVAWLLDGPTSGELTQTPAFSTEIPAATTLLGVTVAGGVATVDLTGEFDDGGGSSTMFARLGQLTFTLLEFDDVDLVMLELEGVPVTVFSAEGIDISGGMDEQMSLNVGLVPEHFNTSPAWRQHVESPITVDGWSRSFEATFQYTLYDNDGLPIADDFVTGGGGGIEWLPFSFEITYTVGQRELGSLELFSFNQEDGTRQFIRETAIWLEP